MTFLFVSFVSVFFGRSVVVLHLWLLFDYFGYMSSVRVSDLKISDLLSCCIPVSLGGGGLVGRNLTLFRSTLVLQQCILIRPMMDFTTSLKKVNKKWRIRTKYICIFHYSSDKHNAKLNFSKLNFFLILINSHRKYFGFIFYLPMIFAWYYYCIGILQRIFFFFFFHLFKKKI